jgi:FkbM family methyltransferase
MKNILQKVINFLGYEIKKIQKNLDFDDIYKKLFKNKKNIIIFDVGANKGQSIERFLKIFGNNCTIHAFEPVEDEYSNLKKKYLNQDNIILNNFALGSANENKDLHIAVKTGASSFNKLQNTTWLKQRSEEYKVDTENFINKIDSVTIKKIDLYCLEKSIQNIDILKIDTQGYEDEVLKGAQEMLNRNIINAIECEIVLDDVYDKRFSFSDLEKYLIPSLRICGIKTYNENLFQDISFFADILYIKQKIISKDLYNEKF